MPQLLRLFLVVLFFATALHTADGDESPHVLFEKDVRPILKTHCWQCHGEEEEVKGGLDTRLAQFLLKGGDSGPSVVPGKHAVSLIYQRVVSGEMPPGQKRISPREIDTLAQWIDAGAKTARTEPNTLSVGDTFTEEERLHWSFQPIRRPSLPEVKQSDRLQSPIDAFILSKLESHGTGFSLEANKATLIRRLYFDLIGLPPDPERIDRFMADRSPDAYRRLVEELLASPAYGERWARHWLDVVGYADSNGYSEKDSERKWAYNYRDFIIRSMNADQRWDQWIVQQLAGDELITLPYQNLTREEADRLIATGFLRMGPDGTGDSNDDQDVAQNQVITETIKIMSTSLLGLTVGCAQCHSHRYDPITQVDYYRIRALLEPAYDRTNWRTPQNRLMSQWSAKTRELADAVANELQEISQQRSAEFEVVMGEFVTQEIAKLPADVQPVAKAARETPVDQRTETHQKILQEYPFLKVDSDSFVTLAPKLHAGFTKKWNELTATTEKKRPAEDKVMCLTEVSGQIPSTRLFYRGDFKQPRQEIAPGELAVLNSNGFSIPHDDERLPTTGRRLAYALHLTSGRHPLVARVLVNRFWIHHFGQGLVATPDDFGLQGEQPSHPELLDWLAADFMHGGWSLKRFHRRVVTSATYRQVSTRRKELEAIDPDNRLLGRMSLRRLEAETIRDSLLALSGYLTHKMFGPPVPVSPDMVGQIVVAVDTRDVASRPTGKVIPLGTEEFRRTIYVQVRRSMPLGMLEPFDLPTLNPNCARRANSTVASQSLVMMNGAFVIQQAEGMATRVLREVGADVAAQFQRAWRLAFGCAPSPSQLESGGKFLNTQLATTRSALSEDSNKKSGDPAQVALGHLCHALLSSNRFLYVD